MNPRGNVQSCLGYWVCFGTRGVVLCKSRDVEIIQDTGGVFNMGGKENGGVGGKNEYIYPSSCNFLVQLVRYDNFDSYPAFGWFMNRNSPAFILHNHYAPHEWEASRRDLLLAISYTNRSG